MLSGCFCSGRCFHVIDVLKHNVRQGKSGFGWMLPVDLALLGLGAYGIYLSTEWLVDWVSHIHTRLRQREASWLVERLAHGAAERAAGVLLQLARPAGDGLCVAGRRRPRVHPLCIGIYALYHTLVIGADFQVGDGHPAWRDAGAFPLCRGARATARAVGWVLVAAYGIFLYKGLLE